ncbi:sodium/calcium exchanger NCL1-like isoform X2 [Quercus robur]|uniref:sodium/calcium exchanger NCL1-like isoform X2 n=1 Tax=Quercus robur TaxID=38942 RepID=UPI002163B0DF|nr:sodium/calcium exchanger NCL1-like isoform X2 [Quercus robur]
MRSNITKLASLILTLSIVILEVHGRRSLRYKSSDELVSDGVHQADESSSLLLLKGMDSGESLVAAGGEQIFKILGPGIFGASAFHVLGALPESLILLASGLLNTKETAQEYVFTGVGLLAGSSIFLLTILWGTCIIASSQDFSNSSQFSNSTQTSRQRLHSLLTGCGISTDLETCYTARIMALSVIPFIIVQSLKIFSSSSAERIVILIAIVVSTVFLFLYFSYQIFEPWIQKRRLEFVKHKNLILSILQHVQKHALGNILTADGAPNVNAIKRLFEEVDRDGDNIISPSDLRELLLEIKFTGTSIDKEKEIGKVMKEFDLDGDQKITMDEFVTGFTKWLDETEHAIDKQYFSKKSLKDVYQVFGPWLLNRRREREMTKDLIQEILRHVQSNVVGGLLKEDGTPDTNSIKRLFEKMEHDSNNCISQHELKELIADIKFGKLPLDVEEAVLKLIEELDTDGDHLINEDEFVSGFAKWLDTTDNQDLSTTESQDDIYQKTWEATDKLVDEKIGNAVVDNSLQAWFKAMMLLVLGIALLAILAEPLIESVQSFSKSASIPSFFISFILVPLATNTRASASAIKEARRKKPRTTSLTFSEIYGGVFMNNILGFSVLLILIYVRELTWEFSAEMLVVLLVCATMGLIASFRPTFPIWTSFLAYLLYPLSLLLVYFFNDVLNYT